jgi:hypothetical protein
MRVRPQRFEERLKMTREIVPPPKAWTRSGFTLPTQLLERLEETREQVNSGRQKPDRVSRDDLVRLLLEWALDEYALQKKLKR